MNLTNNKTVRVLAIAPCVQGIGFVVFNGPRLPIDWGVKWIRNEKNAKALAKVAELIACYQPDVVVFEDYRGEGSQRGERVEELLDAIAGLVACRNIKTASYSRGRVRHLFAASGAVTKFQIAKAIAEGIPELASRLPLERKIWLPEHANMSVFDAAALALTHFSMIAPEEDGSEKALAA
jgi:Holliday junction resolvasome RuvABC endonuclease subunit